MISDVLAAGTNAGGPEFKSIQGFMARFIGKMGLLEDKIVISHTMAMIRPQGKDIVEERMVSNTLDLRDAYFALALVSLSAEFMLAVPKVRLPGDGFASHNIPK